MPRGGHKSPASSAKNGGSGLAKLNECFLGFGVDPLENINRLTATCGELLGADCALYNRLERGMLRSLGQWRTPKDFKSVDSPDGHICYDVIRRAVDEVLVVRNLDETAYALTDPNVRAYDLRTYIGRVVKFGGKPLGSLCVVYRQDHVPGNEDLEILGAIAKAIAVEEERKRMEEVLREGEESYRKLSKEFRILLDAIPDNLTYQDRDLKVIWANRGAAEGIGKEVRDLVGKHCHELWQGRNEPCGECPVVKSFSSGKPENSVVSDPKGRTWELRAVPVQDDGGKIVGVVEVGRDITRIRGLEESFRQSQKMEAVGRLAAGIAHDFNNLLMAVTGYSELLQERIGERDPKWKEIEEIRQAGVRAASLTRQLLAFSVRQAAQVKVLDLNGIVTDLVNMLNRLIGEDVELISGISGSPVWVKADPGQIEQMIVNLVVNSREAMPQGGCVTIGTSRVILEKRESDRLGLSGPGDYALLTMSDTGSGMSEEIKSHIFEPYFSTKEKRAGFGLAIVYGIVQQSGGGIRVDSEVDKGTTVEIFLPFVEPVAAGEKEEAVRAAASGSLETILVVEDEKMVRALVCEILRRYGYVVLEACGGDEAIEVSGRHRGPIHLLLTDVVMPWMRGTDLAGNLAPIRPEMKILYMSGYTDDNAIRKGETALKAAFIQKPFGPEALAKKVRDVLDEGRQDRSR